MDVAEAFVVLRPKTEGFKQDAERNILGPLKGIATVAAGAFAAAGVGSLLKDAVGSASDLNETVSKARTIFGPASWELEQWARTAATSFGQSRQQALDAAATFGNLFTQLGIGSDQAAGMSKEMVQLASDFASFHNADITEVIAAQTAAFRDEYDGLQRFLPTINAATVQQRALELTGKKATKELTAQDKALAVQKLMMEGAGAAAGDFARTSDGLANKQRILSARFEDVRAQIGSALLPILTTVGDLILDKVVPAFETVALGVSAFFGALRDPDVTSNGFVGQMEKLAVAVHKHVLPRLREVATFLREHWQQALAAAGAAVLALTAPVGLVVAGVGAMYLKVDEFRELIDAHVVPAILNAATALREALAQALDTIRTKFEENQEQFEQLGRALVDIGRFAADYVAPVLVFLGAVVIKNLVDAIGGVIQTVGIAVNAFNTIVDAVKAMPGRIADAARGMWDGIKDAFREAINWIIEKWNDLEFSVDGFKAFGKEFGGFTVGVPDIDPIRDTSRVGESAFVRPATNPDLKSVTFNNTFNVGSLRDVEPMREAIFEMRAQAMGIG